MTSTIPLSPRERDVLTCRAQGLAYKEGALHLRISMTTFKHYLRRSFEKLNANSSIEAIRNLQLIEAGQKPSKKTSTRIPVLC